MTTTEARPPAPRRPVGRPARARAVAVIPARDEATTVGAVVFAALDARLVGEVVVVDNGSSDTTAAVAAAHGARVVHEPRPGKGEALRTGVRAAARALAGDGGRGADDGAGGASGPASDGIVVFLDADLVGLRPGHVDALVEEVAEGRADMACGLFDRGPLANHIFLRRLPVLTGQRALRRSLFERLTPADSRGYRVEAALNSLVAREGLVRHDRVLDGLWHRTKEEKARHPALGFARKVAMLLEACWAYAAQPSASPGPPAPSAPARPPQGSSRGRS
jgi:glycosyltransferase involved in cell wall biosynthesis